MITGEVGMIKAKDLVKSNVHVRTVTGDVNISNLNAGQVDVISNTGAVTLTNVNGPKVKAGTGSGNITYTGHCSGMGNYVLSKHSGAVDMSLPQAASVDITARSVSGDVQNDFPLSQKSTHLLLPRQDVPSKAPLTQVHPPFSCSLSVVKSA